MPTRLDDPSDTSIAELVHQVIEDGRMVARTEFALYREIALYRLDRAKPGVIALVAAALIALAGLVTLFVMLAIGLAVHIGPVGAGLAVAAVAGLGAWLLMRWGIGRLTALGGDREEQQALKRGESRA